MQQGTFSWLNFGRPKRRLKCLQASLMSNRLKKVLMLSVMGCILSCGSAPKWPLFKRSFVPPGTVLLSGNLYIDYAEITNIDWLEYEYWVYRTYGATSPEYWAILPDTIIWRKLMQDLKLTDSKDIDQLEAMVTYYYRHPAYQNYPLVGVSYEQAVAYCDWRSKRVNESLFVEANKGYKMPLDTNLIIPEKVRYRLPSKEEWELAVVGQFDSLLFQRQTPQKAAYYSREVFEQRLALGVRERFVPVGRWETKAHKSRLNQMIGNLAEMTNIAGIAKGGSYMHAIGDCLPEVDLPYDGPTYWLGFRCVAEVY